MRSAGVPKVRQGRALPLLLLLLLSCQVVSDSYAIPWTAAGQAPLPMRFSRKECWSGLPFPFPGDLPDPGIKPASLALPGGFFTTKPPGKPFAFVRKCK